VTVAPSGARSIDVVRNLQSLDLSNKPGSDGHERAHGEIRQHPYNHDCASRYVNFACSHSLSGETAVPVIADGCQASSGIGDTTRHICP
jgi:hypothetical protein